MKNHLVQSLCAATLILTLSSGPASAAGAANSAASAPRPEVNVTIAQQREVTRTLPSGEIKVEREAVTETKSGDVLVYTLTATNTGVVPAYGSEIEDPVPEGTTLILESLAGNPPSAVSLDGGKSWQSYPATIVHKQTNGSETRTKAPADSYSRLRWVLGGTLKTNESRQISFKVRVR